jgi:hypothetical protein
VLFIAGSFDVTAVADGEHQAVRAPLAPVEPQEAGTHEVYVTTGFDLYASDRRVIAGLGGGPGYRFHFTNHLAAHVEGHWVSYLGSAFLGAVGGTYDFRFHDWEPSLGLQAIVVAGDQIEVTSSSHTDPAPRAAWAVQARVAPLRFRHAPFVVSVLGFSYGYGDDAKSRATAVGFSIIEIGLGF